MTEEEARAEREEAERLLREIEHLEAQINRAIAENRNLQAELQTLIENVIILTDKAEAMGGQVEQVMGHVSAKVGEAEVDTKELFALIDDLTKSYFTFKNLSTASKNVTQFTDEYYTKFAFYNELRRIVLGYVVGLDAFICSDETMRKKVEKVYLQNTDYWLAYAGMATMLWASDEREAAERALTKALTMDYLNSALYFLLINLRFTRHEAARKWYLTYLDRVDMNNLGPEWQYLLQAYLSGVFGADREFQDMVKQSFMDMVQAMESMHPDYGKRVSERTKNFADIYIHITDSEYENLRRYSPDYQEIKTLLSNAEKNRVLAVYFKKLFEHEGKSKENLFQRIENTLYSLLNSYDKEEYKVIKEIRRNEMIIKAKGDLGMAQQFFDSAFGEETERRSLDDLLFDWAFSEDERLDLSVKKFALVYLKKWLSAGFEAFAAAYRSTERKTYTVEIDGWKQACDENSYETAKASLMDHYNKHRLLDTMKDKFVLIFSGMCLASLVILVIVAFAFNKIALVVGILLGLTGGFLLWRRLVDMAEILRAKREKGCRLLKGTLEDLGNWREAYQQADRENADLLEVFAEIN